MEHPAATTTAEDCRPAATHGCVQPVAINSRPVILVARHPVMPQAGAAAAAAAAGAPVFVIEYQQPVTVDRLVTQHSTTRTGQSNSSSSSTRHKRKRRRKNKVRYEMFCRFES